jgi:hypothetical protein
MNAAQPNKFTQGQRIITNHGSAGVIAKVDVVCIGGHVRPNMSTYTVNLDGNPRPMLMDFVDAHHTSGGCLRAEQ